MLFLGQSTGMLVFRCNYLPRAQSITPQTNGAECKKLSQFKLKSTFVYKKVDTIRRLSDIAG